MSFSSSGAHHVVGDGVNQVAGVDVRLRFLAHSVSSMFLRKISPVEIAGIFSASAILTAWVPLPAPGGPTI